VTAECRARFLFSRCELRSPWKYLRRPRAEAKPFAAVSLQNFSSHKKMSMNTLKGWRRRFNSVPGYHFFNHLPTFQKLITYQNVAIRKEW
jgi:hypothetical protein